jgi:hypothetical protein
VQFAISTLEDCMTQQESRPRNDQSDEQYREPFVAPAVEDLGKLTIVTQETVVIPP